MFYFIYINSSVFKHIIKTLKCIYYQLSLIIFYFDTHYTFLVVQWTIHLTFKSLLVLLLSSFLINHLSDRCHCVYCTYKLGLHFGGFVAGRKIRNYHWSAPIVINRIIPWMYNSGIVQRTLVWNCSGAFFFFFEKTKKTNRNYTLKQNKQ